MMKTKIKYALFVLYIVALNIIVSCSKDTNSTPESSDTGQGGSTSQFTIVGNYMYVVDNQNLKVFDLVNPENPVFFKEKAIGFDIETIFGYRNKLFIGSQWGMYIYDLSIPTAPEFVSEYSHIYSCDPVVANDSLAFVTLRSASDCRAGSQTNQLDVIDISDIYYPKLIDSYAMSSPIGLGIDGDYLFVCDDGIKVLDFSNSNNLFIRDHIYDLETYDVIPNDGILIVTGPDGLYQFDYSNIDSLVLLSSIPISFRR